MKLINCPFCNKELHHQYGYLFNCSDIGVNEHQFNYTTNNDCWLIISFVSNFRIGKSMTGYYIYPNYRYLADELITINSFDMKDAMIVASKYQEKCKNLQCFT